MLPTILPQMRRFARVSCPYDIHLLKDTLREEDLRDLEHISGHTPEEALRFGFEHSLLCVTFFRPGDPLDVIGMGGLVPPAVVWLLFNKDFFARQSDRALFLEMCPLVRDWLLDQSSGGFMHNMTLKRNRRLRHWLRWLGAEELPSAEGSDIINFYFQRR